MHHIERTKFDDLQMRAFPIGWLRFPKAGRYEVSVMCLEGNLDSASLKSIHFSPVY